MKNSIICIPQAVKWTSSLALVLIAVSLSQTASAQPVFLTNYPESSLPVAAGGASLTLNPTASGGANSAAWWQMSNATTRGWVPVNSADFAGVAPVSSGLNWVGALQAVSFQASDAGAYEMVVSNSLGFATSSVINLYVSAGYIAQLANNSAAYGLAALWPLNETNDPSTGKAVAYDIFGGYNGLYGTNAADGGTNTVSGLRPVVGPGSQGYSGLPASGALGVSNASAMPDSYVLVSTAPAFPNSSGHYGTNVSIVGWIYPSLSAEAAEVGLCMERANNVAGLQYGNNTSDQIGCHWDNDSQNLWGAGYGSIPSFTWNMIAMTVSPTNIVFYIGNTNQGISTYTYTTNNQNVPFGKALYIGTDSYSIPSRNFVGSMSCFAMFSNTLSASQIQTLFLAGTTQDKPLLSSQPSSVTVYPGGSAVLTTSALGIGTLYYQWEAGAVGSGVYTNITNSAVFSGANSATLTITDPTVCNQADYVVVVTDSAGQTVSSPATLSFLNWAHPGQGGIVTAVATSPDGNWIASGSDDATVKLWRTSDNGFEFTLAATGLPPVSALAFGPAGSSTLAAGYYDGSIRLWNTTNGTLIRTFNLSWSGHTDLLAKVSSLAFSPNGQQLASGGGEMFTRVWSVSSGALLNSWSLINGVVLSTAFSPNGNLLALSGEATNLIKSIVVLNTATWSTVATLYQGSNSPAQGSNNVTSLAFSPDGATLASGCLDQTICLWSTANWTLQRTMTNAGLGITSLAFATNGQTLFAGDQGGIITPWTTSSGSSKTSWSAHTGPVWSLACSADSTKLVSGGDDHMVQLWQTSNGAWVTNLATHTAQITQTCFAPNGSFIATAANDASLRLWSAQTGAPTCVLTPHTNQIGALAFSPDATFLASGGGCLDNDICLWNPTNGALLQTIPSLFTNGVTSLAVSPDTSLIAAGGDRYEQIIKVWDRAGGNLAATLAGHASGTSVLAFSPNGRYLASGGMFTSGAIKLWDMGNNGNLASTFNGHTCTVVSISFNPTGTLLASAGQNDGQICVWTNGVATPIWSNILTAQARAVAFSPDGTLLAAAGSDTIQVWRTSNGEPVWTCSSETIGVNSMAFSPNGTYLTIGRDDGTICKMWNPLAAPVTLTLGVARPGRFTISNPSYSPFLSVETSSDLIQWNLLTNLVAATNQVQVTDPSTLPQSRFYRVTTPQ